jgi:hypothetical protein
MKTVDCNKFRTQFVAEQHTRETIAGWLSLVHKNTILLLWRYSINLEATYFKPFSLFIAKVSCLIPQILNYLLKIL